MSVLTNKNKKQAVKNSNLVIIFYQKNITMPVKNMS